MALLSWSFFAVRKIQVKTEPKRRACHLQVNPINDEVPVLVAGLKPVLSCAEGQEIVITAEFIYATDADSDNSSLAFLIARQPYHGVVLRNGVIVDRFIQADITAGIIAYKHTGGQRRVCSSRNYKYTASVSAQGSGRFAHFLTTHVYLSIS